MLRSPEFTENIENSWNFIAFTYDQASQRGTFVINEIFGIGGEDGENTYFESDISSAWMLERAMVSPGRIGSAKFQSGSDNFHGLMSCLQFFPKLLIPSQIFLLSNVCHLSKDHYRRKPCPPGYEQVSNECLKLSEEPMTFSEAELACTSPPEENRMSRLAYPSDYLVQEYLSNKANELVNVDEIWIGLDSRSGKHFTS